MKKYPPLTVARFWSKVRVVGAKDCWPWLGAQRKKGYGGLKVGARVERANRIAWELYHGEELGSRLALHHCDNPSCCNPRHIYAGSASENVRDAHHRGLMPAAKLSLEQATEIRSHAGDGASVAALAKDYGVSKTCVSRVVNGKTWVPSGKTSAWVPASQGAPE